MKSQNKKLFYPITRIVNKYDPIELLKIGAPKDEYAPEIEQILTVLPKAKNATHLRELIHTIFVSMFSRSIAGPKEHYTKLSRELYSLKRILSHSKVRK